MLFVIITLVVPYLWLVSWFYLGVACTRLQPKAKPGILKLCILVDTRNPSRVWMVQ
jgi:hypothetical protein